MNFIISKSAQYLIIFKMQFIWLNERRDLIKLQWKFFMCMRMNVQSHILFPVKYEV